MIVWKSTLAVSGQIGHGQHRVGDVGHIHHRRRFAACRAGGLGDAAQEVGLGVADVDLAAGDVEWPTIERDLAREPCDGVLGGRVRCCTLARDYGRRSSRC